MRLRDDVQRERRFAGGFRTVNFNDAPLGHAADAERGVQRQGACGNGVYDQLRLIAQTHDRALAEILFDLLQRRIERLALFSQSSRVGRRFLSFHTNALFSCFSIV